MPSNKEPATKNAKEPPTKKLKKETSPAPRDAVKTRSSTSGKPAAGYDAKITQVKTLQGLPPKISMMLSSIALHIHNKWNDRSIQYAKQFRGGWEVWLQIELATAIAKEAAKGSAVAECKIEREKQVWAPNGKCDMWISYTPPHHGPKMLGIINLIELKVAYEVDEGGKIRQELVMNRMKKDMEKVSVEKKLHPSVSEEIVDMEVRPICIGLTNFASELRSNEWSSEHGTWDPKDIKYMWVAEPSKAGDSLGDDGLAMIWWYPELSELRTRAKI